MKEATRTLIYAVTAAVAVGGALLTHQWSKPAAVAGFELVGEDFFPKFEDPTLAKSLRVVAYDEDTASISEFEVKQDDAGHWTIPSRNNYPADAEDRLAKTAASIIGIKRGALASRYEADFEKYGVIEPDETDEQKLKGRGQRITLQDADGNKLVDYIIGKSVDNPEGHYYVRVPGEKETYISKFEIDLSTKFTDWIEDDLLQVNQSELAQVKVDNYSIDEQQGAIVGEETNILKKDGADWKLEGLNEETEELKTAEINTMISTLDNLKIVGVRAKPEGLNADLTVSPKAQADINRLAAEMASRGFVVARKRDGDGAQIYANEGELTASTSKGISYTLRFGEIFTGSQSEIEGFSGPVASKKKDAQADDAKADDAKADDKKADDKQTDDADGKSNSDDDQSTEPDARSSRYVFISAAFDEQFVDGRPVKPTEPPKFDAESAGETGKQDAPDKKDDAKNEPESAEPEKATDQATEPDKDAATDTAAQTDTAAETDKDKASVSKDDAAEDKGEKTEAADDETAANKADEPDTKQEESAAAAREAYEAQLRKYESDLKAFEKKVEDGKAAAKKLNDRFGKWYYVISAESFEKLRLSRDAMVKPKEKKDDEAKGEGDPDADKDAAGKEAAGKDADGKAAPVTEKSGTDKSTSEDGKNKEPSTAPAKPTEPAGADAKGAKTDPPTSTGDESKSDDPRAEPTGKESSGESTPGDPDSNESKPDKKPAEPETDPPASEPKP